MKIYFSPFLNLSIFLVIFYLLSDKNLFVYAVDKQFEACRVARSCGNQSISFPFYIPGLQQPYCGYPGFDVSCNNDIPYLSFSDDFYIIREIFYHNQSLIISNAVFFTPTPGCLPRVRNLSLPADFKLAGNQSQLLLFSNCHDSYSQRNFGKYIIGCDFENQSSSVLALPEDERVRLDKQECGEDDVVAAPIRYGDRNESSEGMRGVLERGFMLNWTTSDCSLCQSSGGKCGFETETFHFKCFCPDRPNAARCDPLNGNKNGKLKLGLGLASIVAGLGVLLVTYCCLRKKLSSKTHQNVEALLRNYGPLQVRRYRYSDIKKMTNSFTEKLGKGGFGDVYKGKLYDGSLVAVKVLNNTKDSNTEEFINEVATMSRTSHVNIVSVLGFCFESAKQRALIFEFMPNGSLEKFIFDENSNESNLHQLDWETHYQISLGIARGLEYLHRGCNTRILHFDIKPHNILLDAEFVPKISDFGLAKICTRKESIVSMMGPRGTIGYIAPEVYSRNFGGVSYKSDVYSYGMMVLEMVGGRKNINVRVDNTSEIYFPHWIYRRLEIDEDLGMKRIMNEEDRVKVRKMIIVSLWCIQTHPSTRPTMSRVIEMLEGSLDSLQVPPKPFLSSPPRSPPPDSSSTSGSEQI
ncbi:hypothetical protein UlMin_040509 [Ulmus minor]